MNITKSYDFGEVIAKESSIPISEPAISLNEKETYQALSALYLYYKELQNEFNSANPKQFEQYRNDCITKMTVVYELTKKLENFIRRIHPIKG